MHLYRASTAWTGSTGVGYDDYERAHAAAAPPAIAPLTLSADPAFRGDPTLLNPEQLVVLAASSCQLLSLLASAARARVDVVAYEDDAEGFMPDGDRPMRITRIVLRPRITVRAGRHRAGRPEALADRVRHLCEVAHRECYVSNSLTTEVVVEPTIEVVTGPGG